mmetsp:Transcript_35277/g.34938  ORF Transcript_35277/g.34938 Transcript_35277/m.34938 type:complete len:141 (-) Transcript_35277:1311-1733(-)
MKISQNKEGNFNPQNKQELDQLSSIFKNTRDRKASRSSKVSRLSRAEKNNRGPRLSNRSVAQGDVFSPKDLKIVDKIISLLKQKASKLSKQNSQDDPKLSEKLKLLGKIIQNVTKCKKFINKNKSHRLEQEIDNLVPSVK